MSRGVAGEAYGELLAREGELEGLGEHVIVVDRHARREGVDRAQQIHRVGMVGGLGEVGSVGLEQHDRDAEERLVTLRHPCTQQNPQASS